MSVDLHGTIMQIKSLSTYLCTSLSPRKYTAADTYNFRYLEKTKIGTYIESFNTYFIGRSFSFPPYAGNSGKDIPGLMYLGKSRLRGLGDHHMTLLDRNHSLFERWEWVKPYSTEEPRVRKMTDRTWPDQELPGTHSQVCEGSGAPDRDGCM